MVIDILSSFGEDRNCPELRTGTDKRLAKCLHLGTVADGYFCLCPSFKKWERFSSYTFFHVQLL